MNPKIPLCLYIFNSVIEDTYFKLSLVMWGEVCTLWNNLNMSAVLKELGQSVLKNIFGILGFAASLVTDFGWKYNLTFIVLGLLISAIVHLVFKLHEVDHKKYLKIYGRILGDGIYQGLNIIKIESNSKLQRDTLLTLITKGNSLPQPICLLKILESAKNEEIQAIQLLPEERNLDLRPYFVDANKLDNLYVTVLVKDTELQTFNMMNP